MIINCDCKGQIFLSHPHMNNELFSCSPLNIVFLRLKMPPVGSEYAEMLHNMISSLERDDDVTCLSMRFCSIFTILTGWYGYAR